MAELADASDLGSDAERREGSSPSLGNETNNARVAKLVDALDSKSGVLIRRVGSSPTASTQQGGESNGYASSERLLPAYRPD
jgi:hypothetical protein